MYNLYQTPTNSYFIYNTNTGRTTILGGSVREALLTSGTYALSIYKTNIVKTHQPIAFFSTMPTMELIQSEYPELLV